MVQVNVDGEVLTFNISRPEVVEELVAYVGKYLFDRGRVIKEVYVDGEDSTIDHRLLSKRDYKKVEICSMSIKEDMLQEIAQLVDNKEGIINFMHDFSLDILTTEWVFNEKNSNKLGMVILSVVVLLNRAGALMEGVDKAVIDEVKLLLDIFRNAKNLYTSAMSFADAACVSEIIIHELIPPVERALELIQGPVRDYFDRMVSCNEVLVFQ